MQLKLARHLWGVEKNWQDAFPIFKSEGYSMIESPMPPSDREQEFKQLLEAHGFGYIAMAFSGGQDVQSHVLSFRNQLDKAISLGASQLTVHSGSDAWSRSECEAFYREVVQIEKDSPIPVAHETHRGRIFFNPWLTRDLLEKFDALRLCVDFSHWVCVAERLNWDDAAGSILKLCADRAVHIHSRVGYEEGPQVPDPSAPEYARHVESHLAWWDVVWTSQRSRGLKFSTVTPEFGPPGYMHTLPHTNVPVADLWKVCNWIANRVKDRFESRA